MKKTNFIESYLARFPLAAAICYLAVVAAFLLTTSFYIFDTLERRQAVAEASDILSHLEGRSPASARIASANGAPLVTGSPVLEGPTVTVAGATLLQRVGGAVTRFGGNILSSQVDLEGAHSKDGFVKVSVECEVDQPSLQQLLYDLEAGMPFLFIDQLVAQMPDAMAGSLSGKMRVSLLVSGQWRGTK